MDDRLPWLVSFSEWSGKQLQQGLKECEDMAWRNLRKGIIEEINRRFIGDTYEVVIGGWSNKYLAQAFVDFLKNGKDVPTHLTFEVQKSIKSNPHNNPTTKGN